MLTSRFHLRIGAAVTPLLALLLPLTITGNAPFSPAAAGDAPRGIDARAGQHDIDTSDKAAVAKAYRSRLAENLDVASGWTGSTDGGGG